MGSILVAGRGGQLARALCERAEARGVALIARGRPQLDVEDAAAVAQTIRAIAPSAIVNAAAYTAVDQAETEPERAMAINRDGAECRPRRPVRSACRSFRCRPTTSSTAP
jgi:dTDP-4-dehydrorhamnose reductase